MTIDQRYIIWLLIISCVLTMFLGMWGFMIDYGLPFDDAIYQTIKLFTFNGDHVPETCFPINVARFLAPLVLVLGGFQVIYSFVVNGWSTVRMIFINGHYVVIGGGMTGQLVAEKLMSDNKQVVLIDSVKTNFPYGKNFIHILGDALLPEILKRAKIQKASHVVIATGSEYVNLRILEQIRQLSSVPVSIRFEQIYDIYSKIVHQSDGKVTPFCLSQQVVTNLPAYIDEDMFIFGLGRIGKQLIERYKGCNRIVALEQSPTSIFMTKEAIKDSESEAPVRLIQVNINTMTCENFVDKIKENFAPIEKIVKVFICVGSDWLGFITMLKMMSWTLDDDIANKIEIHLFANNIDDNIPKRLEARCDWTVHNLATDVINNLYGRSQN